MALQASVRYAIPTQHVVKFKDLKWSMVDGKANPADMGTKSHPSHSMLDS